MNTIQTFADSPKGKQFIKAIEKSHKFADEHHAGKTLKVDELVYLAHINDLYTAIYNAYVLGFQKWYKHAEKERR